MNRFRSALFPLIIIVLLVYLASQTLLPGRSETRKMTYSEAIQQVESGAVNEVLFTPTRQQINLTLVDGRKVKVNYPTPQSATQFQDLLEKQNVKFDSKGTRRPARAYGASAGVRKNVGAGRSHLVTPRDLP